MCEMCKNVQLLTIVRASAYDKAYVSGYSGLRLVCSYMYVYDDGLVGPYTPRIAHSAAPVPAVHGV